MEIVKQKCAKGHRRPGKTAISRKHRDPFSDEKHSRNISFNSDLPWPQSGDSGRDVKKKKKKELKGQASQNPLKECSVQAYDMGMPLFCKSDGGKWIIYRGREGGWQNKLLIRRIKADAGKRHHRHLHFHGMNLV